MVVALDDELHAIKRVFAKASIHIKRVIAFGLRVHLFAGTRYVQ